MEDFFNSAKTLAVGSEERAKQIRICKCLCKRLLDSDYGTPYDKETIDKIVKMSFDEFMADINRPVDKKEADVILQRHNHEEMLIQQDTEYLCNTIKKYLKYWWD